MGKGLNHKGSSSFETLQPLIIEQKIFSSPDCRENPFCYYPELVERSKKIEAKAGANIIYSFKIALQTLSKVIKIFYVSD